MRKSPALFICILATQILAACGGGSNGAAVVAPVMTAATPSVTTPSNTSAYPAPLPAAPSPPVSTLTCSTCKRIAFVSARDGNEEIYTVNADGTDLRRLTTNASRDSDPAWSPDGMRIAFVSDRDGRPSLYVMNGDGSGAVRLTASGLNVSSPAWSPDGQWIVFSGASSSLDLWTVPATGGSPTPLFSAPGWDGEASWSPDGKHLVFASDWLAYDFGTELFMINADGSGFRSLIDGDILNRTNHGSPCWGPSGSLVAASRYREIGFDAYDAQLGVLSADGGAFNTLVSTGTSWSRCSWSPDGSMIAYASRDSRQSAVWWVKADGSARGIIMADAWSPDWQR